MTKTRETWRSRWPSWVGYAAGTWSLLYAGLGLLWLLGGPGFPFGTGHDPAADGSLLRDVRPETGAPAIAVLGLLGLAMALVMARGRPPRSVRVVLVVVAALAAVTLGLVLPDARLLIAAGYAPIAPFLTIFGVVAPSRLLEIYASVPMQHQYLLVLGGLVWAGAAVAFWRRTNGVCGNCGRGETATARWATSASAARWGRRAAYVAAAIPIVYAVIRWAWAFGIPLGITRDFLRELHESGLVWAGAWLGTFGVLGSVLTLGLVQRWGEVYPRWIWFRAGRPVPPALAIVPATLVSIFIFTGGLQGVRQAIPLLASKPGEVLANPIMSWPVWGVALAVATLGYYLRRRGQCARCGRNDQPVILSIRQNVSL